MKTELYDWDERTIIINDLWDILDKLEDARYRCEVVAKLMKNTEFSDYAHKITMLRSAVHDVYREIRLVDPNEKTLSGKE